MGWREIVLPHLREFEGFRSRAYQDVAGVWTIGYGHTGGVEPGDAITRAEAERWLLADVESHTDDLFRAIDVPLSEHEKAALAGWAYNVGETAALRSTLLRRLNAGDRRGAADEFLRWNRAGGRVVRGLTRRRKHERRMFLTPDSAPLPPRKPVGETIAGSGAAAVAGGAATGQWEISVVIALIGLAVLAFIFRDEIRKRLFR